MTRICPTCKQEIKIVEGQLVEKVCSVCRQTKDISLFYRDRTRGLDGRSRRCKACDNIKAKRYFLRLNNYYWKKKYPIVKRVIKPKVTILEEKIIITEPKILIAREENIEKKLKHVKDSIPEHLKTTCDDCYNKGYKWLRDNPCKHNEKELQ